MMRVVSMLTGLTTLARATGMDHPGKRVGRTLCEAAQSQVETLGPAIDRVFASSINKTDDAVFAAVIERFLSKETWDLPGTEFDPEITQFFDQHVETPVIQMVLPAELEESAVRDAKAIKDLEREMMRRVVENNFTVYNQWTLEFDNNFVVNPSCYEIYRLNVNTTIRPTFPEMERCVCNSFVVPKAEMRNGVTNSFGLHHAGSVWHELAQFHKHKFLFLEYHRSFHLALTTTSIDASPFSVFDNHVPDQANMDYIFEKLWRDPTLDDDAKRRAAYAYAGFRTAMHGTFLKDMDFAEHEKSDRTFLLQGYLVALHWRQLRNCTKIHGHWWELDPGEALYFNNWRAHSDNGFGTSDKDRATIDVRCYGPMSNVAPLKSNLDLVLMAPRLKHFVGTAEMALDCTLALFNYTDARDFSKTVLDDDSMPLRFAAGSVAYGFSKGGTHDPFHDIHLDAMRSHYNDRVRPVLNGSKSPNWDAFQACVARNAMIPPENRLDEFITFSTYLRATAFGLRFGFVVLRGYLGIKLLTTLGCCGGLLLVRRILLVSHQKTA